jgi:hypothetical protein
MYRFVKAGVLPLALVALSNAGASAGSITPGDPYSHPDPHSRISIGGVESARIRLYEHELDLRAVNPTCFDLKHPVLGMVLASEKGYDAFLSDHTFKKLFCEHTPFVWRVVAGDIFYHKIHPFETAPPVSGGGPPAVVHGSSGGSPISGGGSPPGRGSGGSSSPDGPGGPGGTVGTASVPEPSSWVLMTSGLALAALAYGRRRVYRLATFGK